MKKKHNINTGCFHGTRINPRDITERNTAIHMYKNHLCLNWKYQGISFNKSIEEFKLNFEVYDKVISEKHVKSFNKYKYKPKKVQSQLTNMIVYDLETLNTDRAIPYANCIYRLSKISRKYNRDTTQAEHENFKKDCIVSKGKNSVNEKLDYVLQFKGEPKRVNNKTVKYNLVHFRS